MVRLLLELGAGPNTGYGDALALAARGGYMGIVRMLLDCGAKVNEVGLMHATRNFTLPIVSAVVLEDIKMFYLLRERSARLDTPETGGKAFSMAVEMGLESMVETLLSEGVWEVDSSLVCDAVEQGKNGIAEMLQKHRVEF